MKNKLMKGLLVSSLFVATIGTSFAGTYIGIDYGKVSNEDEIEVNNGNTGTLDNKYSDFSIKFGSGNDGDWKTQVRLSMITFDEALFDASNKDLTEIGVDAIKEFEAANNLYPFIKFGFGFGWMDVDGYLDDSIKEFSFNAGVGVSYEVMEDLDVLAGVDYVGRSWQDIEIINTGLEASVSGSGMKAYAGINYSF